MKRFAFIVLISFSMVGMLQSTKFNYNQQDLLVNKILWQPNINLTWANFKSEPDTLSEYKAQTNTNIKSTPISYEPNLIEYKIENYFNENESWSKDKESISLLRHEKLHFDISELAARKTRFYYSIQDIANLEPSYSKLSKIFKKYAIDFNDSINDLYDKQTNHGIIIAKQKEWEKKITLELKKMEKYSSTKVVIRRVQVK